LFSSSPALAFFTLALALLAVDTVEAEAWSPRPWCALFFLGAGAGSSSESDACNCR
jgi:hypothetical protein